MIIFVVGKKSWPDPQFDLVHKVQLNFMASAQTL